MSWCPVDPHGLEEFVELLPGRASLVIETRAFLLSGKLASVFQPVPTWVPLHQWLAYVSGALRLASGLALIAWKTTRRASSVDSRTRSTIGRAESG